MRNKTKDFSSRTYWNLSYIVLLINAKIVSYERRREQLNAALILTKNPEQAELEKLNYWNYEIEYLVNIKSRLQENMNDCETIYL